MQCSAVQCSAAGWSEDVSLETVWVSCRGTSGVRITLSTGWAGLTLPSNQECFLKQVSKSYVFLFFFNQYDKYVPITFLIRLHASTLTFSRKMNPHLLGKGVASCREPCLHMRISGKLTRKSLPTDLSGDEIN